MRTSVKLLPLVLVLAVTTALGGCAVRITDPGASDSGSAESEGQRDASAGAADPAEASETSETDAGSEVSADEPASNGEGLDREELVAEADTVMRCDGELTITDDAVLVHVDGACDRLILNSSGSQVVVGDVGLLEVIGDANVVLAGEVGELIVNGSANVVQWTGATPTVSDVGSANTLTEG